MWRIIEAALLKRTPRTLGKVIARTKERYRINRSAGG